MQNFNPNFKKLGKVIHSHLIFILIIFFLNLYNNTFKIQDLENTLTQFSDYKMLYYFRSFYSMLF